MGGPVKSFDLIGTLENCIRKYNGILPAPQLERPAHGELIAAVQRRLEPEWEVFPELPVMALLKDRAHRRRRADLIAMRGKYIVAFEMKSNGLQYWHEARYNPDKYAPALRMAQEFYFVLPEESYFHVDIADAPKGAGLIAVSRDRELHVLKSARPDSRLLQFLS